jgi:hypothetical protein
MAIKSLFLIDIIKKFAIRVTNNENLSTSYFIFVTDLLCTARRGKPPYLPQPKPQYCCFR